jgi:WD40 repeat protein
LFAEGLAVFSARVFKCSRTRKLNVEIVPPTEPDLVLTVAWSRDGAYVLSAGSDNAMKLWDVATGRLLARSSATPILCDR